MSALSPARRTCSQTVVRPVARGRPRTCHESSGRSRRTPRRRCGVSRTSVPEAVTGVLLRRHGGVQRSGLVLLDDGRRELRVQRPVELVVDLHHRREFRTPRGTRPPRRRHRRRSRTRVARCSRISGPPFDQTRHVGADRHDELPAGRPLEHRVEAQHVPRHIRRGESRTSSAISSWPRVTQPVVGPGPGAASGKNRRAWGRGTAPRSRRRGPDS